MIAHPPSGLSPHSKMEGLTIRKIFAEMSIAFDHRVPLLLVGETGTGKKFLSQSLHRQLEKEKYSLPDAEL